MSEIFDLKITLGILDLKKYALLLREIEDVPSEYDIDINIELSEKINIGEDEFENLIFDLHSKLGNTLSELEFKLNQIRIQARLKSLDLGGDFDLNKKLKFSELTEEVVKLLDNSKVLSEDMKKLIL